MFHSKAKVFEWQLSKLWRRSPSLASAPTSFADQSRTFPHCCLRPDHRVVPRDAGADQVSRKEAMSW